MAKDEGGGRKDEAYGVSHGAITETKEAVSTVRPTNGSDDTIEPQIDRNPQRGARRTRVRPGRAMYAM